APEVLLEAARAQVALDLLGQAQHDQPDVLVQRDALGGPGRTALLASRGQRRGLHRGGGRRRGARRGGGPRRRRGGLGRDSRRWRGTRRRWWWWRRCRWLRRAGRGSSRLDRRRRGPDGLGGGCAHASAAGTDAVGTQTVLQPAGRAGHPVGQGRALLGSEMVPRYQLDEVPA